MQPSIQYMFTQTTQNSTGGDGTSGKDLASLTLETIILTVPKVIMDIMPIIILTVSIYGFIKIYSKIRYRHQFEEEL